MPETTDTKQPSPLPPIDVKVTATPTPKASSVPPFFSFQITNPITYIKAWWKKIVGNEGIKLTLQIRPLTALFLIVAFSGIGFGFGRLTVPESIIKYLPLSPSPSPSPTLWKDTAYTGKLQYASNRYFLVTTSAEAITLEVPSTINLKPLVGKRLMVAGLYNKDTKTLIVSDTADLEVLSTTPIPIPTIIPSPSPLPTVEPTPLEVGQQ